VLTVVRRTILSSYHIILAIFGYMRNHVTEASILILLANRLTVVVGENDDVQFAAHFSGVTTSLFHDGAYVGELYMALCSFG
jgi:hypothetical protein